MESFAAGPLVAFVTVGLAIVDAKYAARTFNREGDFVIGGGNNPSLCIQHLDGDVSDVAWVRWRCAADRPLERASPGLPVV